MSDSLLSRGIERVKKMIAPNERLDLTPKEQMRLREQLKECAQSLGGEVSTRQRAIRLSETYLKLSEQGRHDFLRLIALEFGPDPSAVAQAHAVYQEAIGSTAQWDAEAALRAALRSSRIRILTQLNAQPQGVKFLVDLRTDLLRYLEDDPELAALDRELEARLSAWFDVGFLELQRITWSSPAILLEKLIAYEAVHEIRSWADLKNRLDSDRRCYAFFHPRMPLEPLIFVEVALTASLANNVQHLLDEHAPVFDAERADTAIFYSISNTQAGLRVVDDLKRDFPRLNTFATLSPLPQFARWIKQHPDELTAVGLAWSAEQLARGELSSERKLRRRETDALLRLGARYLASAKNENDQPYDPVARFHLGNGARIERLNADADTSVKGLHQSFGLMVNYLYDPQAIETNVEAYVRAGSVATSAAVRRQAKREESDS